jgi:zinc protease
VEHAITQELERFRREEVSPAELEKAKRQFEAELVLANEEPLQQAMLLGQYETIAVGEMIPKESRGHKYLDSLLPRILAVTASDLARVAGRYLVDDNRTVGYLVNDK